MSGLGTSLLFRRSLAFGLGHYNEAVELGLHCIQPPALYRPGRPAAGHRARGKRRQCDPNKQYRVTEDLPE